MFHNLLYIYMTSIEFQGFSKILMNLNDFLMIFIDLHGFARIPGHGCLEFVAPWLLKNMQRISLFVIDFQDFIYFQRFLRVFI